MTDTPANKQQSLWHGDFGNEYTDRNAISDHKLAELTKQWCRILHSMQGAPPRSILEVGSNIGLNLRTLSRLTDAERFALEPNDKARKRLLDDGVTTASNTLSGFSTSISLPDNSVDLAFTSGVLIHIHPDQLLKTINEIYRVSRRYIVCIEYFADSPQTIVYRGVTDALFKRDFGGYYMDTFPDLRLLDYGFSWKRATTLDNLTWWVFEKSKS